MDIPWGLIAPIVILDFILVIAALVSCIKEENTNGPKWMWILIILFLNLIGPVLYFVIGRQKQ
ncbi:PLDc N-terminal domain-containing protein [Bacillus norwichensis]|uniref:PLDc N-terminal domain-containing protein n=1 Tax=Bacillus norwichensis TaxID=2762217 RepID=A0ABR8VMP6_9BACI|nr:PLDc N-terminal domain-containing protein [Bacillus norwichensis]MBD8006003.1 PLDc N-terminal domain-containing protein [Bacillus norwichensis]